MEEKVLVGKILTTHALKGEVKIKSFTDYPDVRFAVGSQLFIGDLPVTVITHRQHKGMDLISFENMQDINAIEKYKGAALYAIRDDSLLADGQVWTSDLYNCEVYDQGRYIGDVTDVYINTYQNILEVNHNGKKVLIPMVDQFIKNKDVVHKRIDVELIKGFIDDED